jgi:hypothetical protein
MSGFVVLGVKVYNFGAKKVAEKVKAANNNQGATAHKVALKRSQ